MSVTTGDNVANLVANSKRYSYQKTLTAPKSAGAFQSAWLNAGAPGAGAAPPAYTAGAGYTCDRTTVGALGQANGAVQNWLSRLTCSSQIEGTLVLLDRLWACSNMGFANATYTVTTPGALPARITDNGVGVEAWVEQYVAAGAASGNLTVTYVNEASVASRTGVITGVVSAPVVGQMQLVPRQVGDLGISQVTNAINSATWTSGSWGIVLAKRIAEISVDKACVMRKEDWSYILSKIAVNACIQLVWFATSTTIPSIFGSIDVGDL